MKFRLDIFSVLIVFYAFILISCEKQSEYIDTLNKYVKEDIAVNRERKHFELTSLEYLALEKPEDFETMYEEALKIDKIISENETYIFETENLDSINLKIDITKNRISNLELKEYKFLNKELFPKSVSNTSDKYMLLSRLNNFRFDRYNTILGNGCDLSDISSYNSKMLASRLNDSIVVLNIYSRAIRDYKGFFPDEPSLYVTINKQDNASQFQGFYIKPQTSCAAYIVKSKSDTLYVDATITSNGIGKHLISRNSSYVRVGELIEFQENHLRDYLNKIK